MKKRLDILLLQRGLFPSRERAQSAIITGKVMVNQKTVVKPGTPVDPEAAIEVRGHEQRYVSRGGLKLERALKEFWIDLKDQVVLDVGSSTGGFTDCALQQGAKRVLAVDVGYGQMAWSIRQDPRVRLLERTNIRFLTPETLGETADLAVIDVSFISLALVLPAVKELLTESGRVVALIKPQFEAGREKVGKRGVVKEPETHREVIKKVVSQCRDIGFRPVALTYSPITGPEGNIEYLLFMEKGSAVKRDGFDEDGIGELIKRTVAEAHQKIKKREVWT